MNIKEFGFDKLVNALRANENPEYINGLIDTIENIFDMSAEEDKSENEEQKKEPEEVAKPKAAAKPKKKTVSKARKEIDMGKVGALRNAGWSWEKIGDEFSVSAQTVINHWNAYQKSLK